MRQRCPVTQPSPLPHHKSWRTPNLTTRRICTGKIFFARTCSIDAQLPARYDRAPTTRHTPPHHGFTGEKYFAPTCAVDAQSPNHQTSPHPKSWRTPNSPPHHGCTGEIFFAPTYAIDAQSPTRCDRARATRRRNTDVGAKYFSPVRARLIRNRPHVVIARPPCATAP